MKRQIRVDTAPGVTIAATGAGEGPLVILMHGWPELGLSWRHQIDALVQAGYCVAVPDQRGYGASSKPAAIDAYSLDWLADDMSALAGHLGARTWVAVGHDWGSPVAFRCALRFPDAVRGVFSLSVPHVPTPPEGVRFTTNAMYPDRFYYVRYFQQKGVPETELDADPRAALKRIFFALSGDAPGDCWIAHRPADDPLLPGLPDPPEGPLSFMSDAELDAYARAYRDGGFRATLNWYRNLDANAAQGRAYGAQRIRQPAGFLCGDKEILLSLAPGGLDRQRSLCDDLRCETILPDAGHWIQQERPEEVNAALIAFLSTL